MDSLNGKASFSDFLELNVFLNAYERGLGIQVILSNTKQTNVRNVAQEYPHFILNSDPSMNLGYVSQTKGRIVLTILDSNVGLWNLLNNEQSTDVISSLVPPQHQTFNLDYFSLVLPGQWIRMKELAEKNGVIEFNIHLTVSFTYRPNSVAYEFLLWHPVISITASKAQLEEFITTWAKSKESLIDLPSGLPPEILRDMVEASKCVDIEASRAAAAMVRRALQQALLNIGTQETDLYLQIEDLKNRNMLSPFEVSFAHGIRFLGNYGAHPQDDLLKEVTLEDAREAFQAVSKILRQLYSK